MPIELVRIHPEPPLFVCDVEDGSHFEEGASKDPERTASVYAYEQGLDVGESVWIGWGKLPPTDDDRDFDVEHVEEWVVLWTNDDDLPLVLPAAPGWLP